MPQPFLPKKHEGVLFQDPPNSSARAGIPRRVGWEGRQAPQKQGAHMGLPRPQNSDPREELIARSCHLPAPKVLSNASDDWCLPEVPQGHMPNMGTGISTV
jgi:hypothetical protein